MLKFIKISLIIIKFFVLKKNVKQQYQKKVRVKQNVDYDF